MNATPRKGLGLWMCTALVLGNMIGSGVFLLPAALAPYGGMSIVGWLISAGGAVCLALVFAHLAMRLHARAKKVDEDVKAAKDPERVKTMSAAIKALAKATTQ